MDIELQGPQLVSSCHNQLFQATVLKRWKDWKRCTLPFWTERDLRTSSEGG